MTGTIVTTTFLVVSPSLNAEGRKAYSTRGQLFDGKLDGRSVVKRSPTPFCAAARVLLAEGADPPTRLACDMRGHFMTRCAPRWVPRRRLLWRIVQVPDAPELAPEPAPTVLPVSNAAVT